MEKISIAKKYEINIAEKLPLCKFVMKNQYCRKYYHFQKYFAKNLSEITQTFAILPVKHLVTLVLATVLLLYDF